MQATPIRVGLIPQESASPGILEITRRQVERAAPGRFQWTWLVVSNNVAVREELKGMGISYLEMKRSDVGTYCDVALVMPHDRPEALPEDVLAVHMEAGLGATKSAGTKNATYSRERIVAPGDSPFRAGLPLYDAAFVSSDDARRRVADAVPEIADRTRVIGDPSSDLMLLTLNERDGFRESLGISAHQRAVIVGSAWTNTSVAALVGPKIFDRVLADSDNVLFVVSHPRLDHEQSQYARDWTGAFSRLQEQAPSRVFIPTTMLDTPKFIAAGDVAVVDASSSFTMKVALARRKMIFVEGTQGSADSTSPIARLYRNGIIWTPEESLTDALDRAEIAHPPARQLIAKHLGVSGARIASELTRLVREHHKENGSGDLYLLR